MVCLGQTDPMATSNQSPNEHPISPFLFEVEDADNSVSNKPIFEAYDEVIERLEILRKKKKSDSKFLRSIFYRVHQKSLVTYEKQATMAETMLTGNFGCLTGTALYALILTHFDFIYEIIELPNHVFLKLVVDGQTMLIESTNPEGGLIRLNEELEQNMEQIAFDTRKLQLLTTVGEGSVGEWDLFEGHVKINLQELAGLQYFNEAVRYYIKKEYVKSMDMIAEAYERYPSKRNEKLMQLVINKILKYDLIKEELKNKYLKQYVTRVKGQKISQTK